VRHVLFFFFALTVFNCSFKKGKIENKLTDQKLTGGIYLPTLLEPIEVRDELLPNGDGYLVHRYSIDENLYTNILNQFEKDKIRKLPFADDIFIDNLIYEFVDDSDQGDYTITSDKEDPRDIMVVVLNSTKKELIIFNSKQ